MAWTDLEPISGHESAPIMCRLTEDTTVRLDTDRIWGPDQKCLLLTFVRGSDPANQDVTRVKIPVDLIRAALSRGGDL